MAKRARQVERVREAFEEQKEGARADAEQEERLGRDGQDDDRQDEPDPRTKSSEPERRRER
jgi:hypothetical protein